MADAPPATPSSMPPAAPSAPGDAPSGLPPGFHGFPNAELDTNAEILLACYAISLILSLELIAIFTRVSKNLTLRVFAAVYCCFVICVFVGVGVTHGNIAKLEAEACRAQSLLMLYLLSILYSLSFFLTFNVWSAVCTRKFRDQETRRFPMYLGVSVLAGVIPTVIVGVLNSRELVGLGFGPHRVYCSYIYPISSYAYGPLWYNAAFILATLFMIIHAGMRLFTYRKLMSAAAAGSRTQQSSGNNKRSSSSGTSGAATISLTMCYRFGVWGLIYLIIMACANYRQIRAVVVDHYEPADLKIGVREYAGSFVGIAFWIVFGTGRAAWQASTPYVIYKYLRPAPASSLFNDSYDLRTYYEMGAGAPPQVPAPAAAASAGGGGPSSARYADQDPYGGSGGGDYRGHPQQQQQQQQRYHQQGPSQPYMQQHPGGTYRGASFDDGYGSARPQQRGQSFDDGYPSQQTQYSRGGY
ncbi:hypothetical protein HDU87_007646 [Geranomyces variabilis]|uniref:G-protein coupled receptors family 2 profile 2 domain-containing protein n=1 Tax=Geranomyces variabilis TaxID=109894 RepID=A0AAD5TDQ2_9FUNG|nr:hypothetical protein HDU87_007646 [Geranomyces variabilis]